MLDEVKVCVAAKVNYFEAYFTVPAALRGTLDEFAGDVNTLGEASQSATDFEAKFISSGLSGRFQTLLQQCTPKARKMTKEEKKKSVEITKDIIRDNRKEIVRNIAVGVAERVSTDIRSDMATASREQMIKDGTYAEHTIARNNMDNIGFLARLFRKKTKPGSEDDE